MTARHALSKKPGILFLHIPKTGGSSLSAALRRRYRWTRYHVKSGVSTRAAELLSGVTPHDPGFLEARQDVRAALIAYEALRGRRFLTGHVWYQPGLASLRASDFKLITCLRHPVDRWYSAYFYDRAMGHDYSPVDDDPQRFLDHPRAREMGSLYVRYIGGPRPDREYESSEAVDQARRNLEDFDLVTFIEQPEALVRRVRETLGLKVRLPHRRRSPASREEVRSYKESPEHRRAVEELCAPDIEIYEHALRRFGGDVP